MYIPFDSFIYKSIFVIHKDNILFRAVRRNIILIQFFLARGSYVVIYHNNQV